MTGFTLWFTGLPCSGKTTLSTQVAHELQQQGFAVEVFDGDRVRMHLCQHLGYSRSDRDTNVRRVGYVCNLLAKHNVIAIAALISPYRQTREELKQKCKAPFVEVFVDADVDTCAARDVKGHYARARRGELQGFTGVDDPYEEPWHPDIVCHTHQETPSDSVAHIIDVLRQRGLLDTNEQARN